MSIGLGGHFTYNKLIRFTLPTIIMMILTSIYGVVDGIFVSNRVGSEAFAAVNLIMPAIMILGTIGFMMGTGGSALVSKTIGEGDKEKANRYFSMLIYLLIIIGIVLTIIGIILIEPMAKLLGADKKMLNDCVVYGRTLLIFLVPFCLQNSFQSFLIVAEKPTLGLVVSIISGVCNVTLDFLLIYVFEMGVFGAALATGISQVVGVIIPLLYFITKKSSILRFTKTRFELKPIVKTFTNGSSEMLTNLSTSLVSMLFNAQLMKYAGSDGVVAYGIIMYAGFIFSGIYMGYALGSAPIVGFHYGAKNTDELKNLLKKSIILIAVTAIVITGLAEILSRMMASIFVGYDMNLMNITTKAIRLFSISYLISGFNIFASSFFTALNNGLVSAIISFLRTLVFQVVMIYLLPAIWGINGIWLAVVFAEILSLIVSVTFLVKNKKKYQYA
ncbi:MAG: MATE family efflux transporter [Lachnospiraceae bacterium]|nr:MATE family efflux transporter [Lachnospiraceae bacterium]